jgi:hypothetical protein
MTKPNENFKLTVSDIDIIELALNNKVHRRSMIVSTEPDHPDSKSMQVEISAIRDLLGRIHNQKIFYRPKNRFAINWRTFK